MWNGRIDPNRISVVGFVLGATAALSAVGAELDAERYVQSCAANVGTEGPDCGWYAAQSVSLTQTDQASLARRMHDPRFASAVTVEFEDLAAFGQGPADVPVQLLSLGTRDSGPVGIQPTQSVFFPDVSIFATCTEAGPDILLEEYGDASICGASPAARKKAYLEIFGAIRSFLAGKGE